MKKKLFIIAGMLFLVMFVFSACKEKSEVEKNQKEILPPATENKLSDESDLKAPTEMRKMTVQTTGGQVNPEEKIDATKVPRMVIKNGEIKIEIDNYDESEKKVVEIAGKFNGYLASSNSLLSASGKKQGTIVLKMPSDKFDAALMELKQVGKVMSDKVTSRDITEEYIDLEARLKNQKEFEQRLLKLLTEKATRLSDIIEVEQKLASVRQTIETIEGKMKYLKGQADFSTITINLFEPSMIETSSGGGFFYEIGQSIKKGLKGFTVITGGIITVIISLLPVVIFVLLIVWIVIRIVRKKTAKKQNK